MRRPTRGDRSWRTVMKAEEHRLFDVRLNVLHEEWSLQPRLFREACGVFVERRADWERAKSRRDVVKARMARTIRQNPADYGLSTKPSNDAVSELVVLTKEYKEADQAVIEAHLAMGIAEANKDAYEQRKWALMDLVKMRLADMFAVPKIADDEDGTLARQAGRLASREAFRGRKKGES